MLPPVSCRHSAAVINLINMRVRISLPGLCSTNSQTKQSSVRQKSLLLSFHSIWRLDFLSVPLLYGTTFLPFAFCWVILSRNCNEFKTDTSRIRGGKQGGEILPLEKLDVFCSLDKELGDEFHNDFVQVYHYSFGENDGQLFRGQLFRRIVLTILRWPGDFKTTRS